MNLDNNDSGNNNINNKENEEKLTLSENGQEQEAGEKETAQCGLLKEERPFKEKLLLAAFPSFLLAFTYLIFAPIDLTVRNARYLSFGLDAVAWPFILIGLGLFVVLTVILMFTRGRLFDALICLVFGLALCSYVQGNFLNLDLGTLDGTEINWSNYTKHGVFNSAVWLAILAVPFLLHRFLKKIWKRAVLIASFLVIGMQLVALIFSVMTIDTNMQVEYYLSKDKQFELSSEENVVVFILDSFQSVNPYDESMGTVETILEMEPRNKEVLKDFTNFQNTSANYHGTFPGLCFLLTGHHFDVNKSYTDYFRDAWEENTLLEDFHAAGFSNGLYISPRYATGTRSANDIGALERQIDNLVVAPAKESDLDRGEIYQMITYLSCYRYMPHVLKPAFWLDTGAFNAKTASKHGYKLDDPLFYQELEETGISLQSDSKRLTFYFLTGVHGPLVLDEHAQRVEESSRLTQALGSVYIIEEFINQLKEKGVYDNTTIVITADHGNRVSPTPCFLVKPKNANNDQMIYNQAPLTQEELRPTLLQCAGIDYEKYGRSAFDFDENEERERSTFVWFNDERYAMSGKFGTLNAQGKYNVYYEYIFNCNVHDYNFSKLEPSVIHLLKDSFY